MTVLTEVQDLEAVIRYAQSLPYTGDTLLLMGLPALSTDSTA